MFFQNQRDVLDLQSVIYTHTHKKKKYISSRVHQYYTETKLQKFVFYICYLLYMGGAKEGLAGAPGPPKKHHLSTPIH